MTEILSELRRILDDVRQKTGVDVSMEPSEDRTPIRLEYCGEKADVYFRGTKEEAEKTSALLQYLVSNADYKHILPDRDEFLKSILLGEGNKAFAYKYLTKYNLTDGECFALDVLPEKRMKEVLKHFEFCLQEETAQIVKMDDSHIAVILFSPSLPPLETGRFLSQSAYEELGVKTRVGVGCEVKSFTEIATSYQQAETAVRMSAIFSAKGEVHAYREFLLVKMLDELSKEKRKEYMEQFRIEDAEEVLSDREMMATAEEFLDNSLNISETSRKLFMHRNTLMYRLDKIERVTGLNIRNFADAVTFRVITILYRLLKA